MHEHVLLIDDDADDVSLFLEALAETGHSVYGFSIDNGPEALEKLSSGTIDVPDLIFLDINLPGMNGWDCLTLLKTTEKLRHIPVIIYSTSSHTREADKAERLGATGFLTKPYDYKELTSILQTILITDIADLPQRIKKYCSA